jgi:hypothetical protein
MTELATPTRAFCTCGFASVVRMINPPTVKPTAPIPDSARPPMRALEVFAVAAMTDPTIQIENFALSYRVVRTFKQSQRA